MLLSSLLLFICFLSFYLLFICYKKKNEERYTKGNREKQKNKKRHILSDAQGGREIEKGRLKEKENCVILQSGCEMFAFLCLFISQPALRSDAMLKTKICNKAEEIKNDKGNNYKINKKRQTKKKPHTNCQLNTAFVVVVYIPHSPH